MTNILIVSEAFEPQVNGVVRTLQYLMRELVSLGVKVDLLTPREFPSLPWPTVPSVRLSLALPGSVGRRIAASRPDFVHIATEGPLGWAARHWCMRVGRRFTTSYHTRFPEYLREWLGLSPRLATSALRRFHNAGAGCMVAAPSLRSELSRLGFLNIRPWSRGVDLHTFRPLADAEKLPWPKPIFLTVGRVAREKNLEAFLRLDLPGSKVMVGDGPILPKLRRRYPDAVFVGEQRGEALARLYAGSDVFVFPSIRDTFGLVLLEALSSGLAVAAFPVTGPLDVIGATGAGILDTDLRAAALAALGIPKQLCRDVAARHSWRAVAEQFLDNIGIGAAPERLVA